MSILLEALRKSEKNQHLRETPTIHTQNEPEPVSDAMPARWLILLLVVAVLVIGWLVWRQYQQPVGDQQAVITDTPEVANETQVSKPVDTKKPVGAKNTSANTKPSQPVTRPSAGQSRTPVESYQAPEVKKPPPRIGGRPVEAGDNEAVADGSAANARPKPRPGSATSQRKPGTRAASKTPGGVTQEKYSPSEPEPISYWELPDSVRSDVPEIKFSVLVYAVKPADRFVLINGQRLGEGDTAQPGLVVKEIRRDGVIFTYRLYQFLVER